MTFDAILSRFTAAVEAGDGTALGALFTQDGTYHDTFYGEFHGPSAIRDMLENYFWRDAEAFRWDMNEPLANDDIAYANWRFSYSSKLEGVKGKRIVFEGMSRFRLKGGLINRYDEIFDIGIALSQTDFTSKRMAKIIAKAAERLRSNASNSRHLID